MASFELPLKLYSANALAMIDLAYVEPGSKASTPRIKQIDDLIMSHLVSVLGKDDHPLMADAAAKMEEIESIVQAAAKDLTSVRKQLDLIIKDDLFFSSIKKSKRFEHVEIKFKGRNNVSGAMLRVVVEYDRLVRDALVLLDTGAYLLSGAKHYALLQFAGAPVRTMLQDILIVLKKWAELQKHTQQQ